MKSAREWAIAADIQALVNLSSYGLDLLAGVFEVAIAEARREAMAAVCPACAAGIQARLSDQGRWVHMPFEGRDECDSHAIRALATEPAEEDPTHD